MLPPLLIAALIVGGLSFLLVTPTAVAQTSVSVSIHNFAFSPSSVTVSTGATVTWTNNDNVYHTVTALDGSFNSGNIAPGQSFSHTFVTSGTVNYECTIHPYMKGAIIVVGGATYSVASTTQTTASSTISSTPTTTATSSSSSSGAIPEFPLQTVAVVAMMIAILASYLAIRQSRRS